MVEINFLKEAESLADYLIEITKNQKIALEYTDLQTNNNFGNVMVDDFGDYIPFVYWLGKISKEKYCKWAKEKGMFIIEKFQMPNGLLYTSFKKKNKTPKRNNFKSFDADKMSDAALGLHLMYDLTKKPIYKNSLTKFFSGLKTKMTSKKGYIFYKRNPFFHYPFSMGKYCGLYIEELAKLYESTNEKYFLNLAEKLASPWIYNSFFQKNGLFPFKCTSLIIKPVIEPLFKKITSFTFNTAMLTKSNTNMIFGLVRLQNSLKNKQINNALNKWVNAVDSNLLSEENILYSIWNETKKFRLAYLAADHAAIDALLEIYLLNSNKKALNLAIKITDGWLKYQSASGLIPETPYIYNTSKLSKIMKNKSMQRTNISRLDSQTDFAIMVLKIYELTKKTTYLNKARKIVNGIIKHHKFKKGFVEFIDVDSHKKHGFIIETKFLFLLLKLLILFHEIDNGKRIYKNTLIKDIIRDR